MSDPLPTAEDDALVGEAIDAVIGEGMSDHGPDLTTPLPDPFAMRVPACKCGRTFESWRAQGIHETAERKKTGHQRLLP